MRLPSIRPRTLVAWLSLSFMFGGCWASHSPWVDAHHQGVAIDFTRHVLYCTDTLPDVLFAVGTLFAAIFVLAHVYEAFDILDPYRKHRRPPD